jgi:hypothetical protein
MNARITRLTALAVLAAVGTVQVACSSSPARDPLVHDHPQISLRAANEEIVVGDTTTLTINSKNTLGRDARVEWTTTGGDLNTEDGDRVARVRFDQPGVYTVTAKLVVDGEVVDREAVNIEVRPLK